MAAHRSTIIGLSAGLLALVLAACTSASTPAPTAAPAGGGSGSGASSGATVSTASTSKGSVLAGPTGMTLYTYAKDSSATSACSGGCATAWPPLTVPAGQAPTAGSGVTGTLATLTRADGTVQVTYNGWPLYYWKGDKAAGDVTGDGVDSFALATPTVAAAPMAAPAVSPAASQATDRSGRRPRALTPGPPPHPFPVAPSLPSPRVAVALVQTSTRTSAPGSAAHQWAYRR